MVKCCALIYIGPITSLTINYRTITVYKEDIGDTCVGSVDGKYPLHKSRRQSFAVFRCEFDTPIHGCRKGLPYPLLLSVRNKRDMPTSLILVSSMFWLRLSGVVSRCMTFPQVCWLSSYSCYDSSLVFLFLDLDKKVIIRLNSVLKTGGRRLA